MTCQGALKRVVYTSRVQDRLSAADLMAIYDASRRNNGVDGVTGVLWVENGHFLQLIEGPQESVDLAFSRIMEDSRHGEIVVLEDAFQDKRVFADWAMAGLPGERPADALERLGRLLRHAPDDVTRFFPGLFLDPAERR